MDLRGLKDLRSELELGFICNFGKASEIDLRGERGITATPENWISDRVWK
jgi:hypothetical protein